MNRLLLLPALLLAPLLAAPDQNILREYGVATTVDACLGVYDDPVDFEAAATFEAGDVVVMKDEGAPANIGTLPTDEGTCYSMPLTGTEMSAARITITLIDQTATKVWMDHSIYIETYGNASSQHPDIGSTAALDLLAQVAPSELMLPTTIATLASQVSFTLAAGSADDDAYNGHYIVIVDQSTSTQRAVGVIQDYVGSTRTVTLRFDPAIFTMAVGDFVYIRTEKQ